MSMPVHKLAIYDMDRTITIRGTYTPFLLHVAARMAPWRLILAPIVLLAMLAYVTKLIRRKTLKELNQRLMIGGRVSRARLAPHIESYADGVMAKNTRAGALARIAQDKAEGYTLVLATASYRLYVDAIAKRLGFDAVIATDHLGQDLDYVRAKIAGENCYDAAKLRMIADWMAGEGITREAAHIRAYSDHVSDAPMLEFADEPYAANPHKPLAILAQVRGWKRVDWV
ncbi:HAD-IB family hydrolase [Sphingobium sp. DEHP117]|uniref:HAD family hydrolase n=1 Tax=Sphingobium sp. DEHP117 TaxID=2993436 RepID=UPI0027D69782|nr:HAD-IB family hydrolase [Sphingobium sp. DEHP117]MDQ4421192.1 HAD-IB family hydrolase [Sphingobium sp. DEHP117]